MKQFRWFFLMLMALILVNIFPNFRGSATQQVYRLIEIQNNDVEDKLTEKKIKDMQEIGVTASVSFEDGEIKIKEFTNDNNIYDSTLKWIKMPKTINPGEKLSFTASSIGYRNTTRANFLFCVGDTFDHLNVVKDESLFGEEDYKDILFDIPSNRNYFTLSVAGSNGRFGIDKKYIYKLDAYEEIDSGARFSIISGQVEVLQPNSDEWEYAKMETKLLEGAMVRTAMGGECILSFKDYSTFHLKEESEIQIAILREDNSKIKLVLGKLWANIKKMAKDGKMEISTTQAVAGIKGTVFSVEATKDKTTLEVLEGKVEYTCLATGEKTFVETGKTAYADQYLSPVTAFDVGKDKIHWDKVGTKATDNKKSYNGFSWLLVIGIVFVIVVIVMFAIDTKKI